MNHPPDLGAPPMPRRAYPYGRESDPRQRHGDGPARQKDFAAQISEQEGWYLDDTYHFADLGRSGFHGEHLGPKGHLTRFLGMVRAGTITPGSVLILENLDRLSRQQVREAHKLFSEILDSGVWVATKQPRRVYRPESSNLMDLMEPIWLFYLAHEESAKKSLRVAHAWQTRRASARQSKEPHGGRIPDWLTRNPDGSYALPEANRRTLREIFRSLRDHDGGEGIGVHRLAAYLNANPDLYPCFSRSGRWNKAYLRKIVRGREVLGEYQPHTGRGPKRRPEGEPILGYYPRAVQPDERLLALAALGSRRHKTGRPGQAETNLFTGLVYEAGTGQRMSVDGHTHTGLQRHRYLIPSKDSLRQRSGRSLPYGQFEDGVRKRIGQLTARDVLPAAALSDEREQRIAGLTGQLVTLDHRAGEVQQQIEDPENALAVAHLARALNKILADKKAAAAELEALKLQSCTGRAEALAAVHSLDDLLAEARGKPGEADLRRKLKAAIRSVVEEIWLVVQPLGRYRGVRTYVGHAQIYLRSGARRYVQLAPAHLPPDALPWDLGACDFRAGDVGDVARRAASAQLVG